MQVKNITVTLRPAEMFDLAYSLEHSIDLDIIIGKDSASDIILNDFESELNLLQTFVDYGYSLDISKKTKEGYSLYESNKKKYTDTQEWFKDLLKQRRKEKLNND